MALKPPPIQAPITDSRSGLANVQWLAWFQQVVRALGSGSFSLTWGAITGSLSAQTDLQAALDAKLSSNRNIATELPLTGGGDLTADITLGIEFATDGTVGVVRPDGTTITIDPDGVISAGSSTPGGSDKSVQYNDAGVVGGVSVNATAANNFLRQVSSGTPSFELLTVPDYPFHDEPLTDGASNIIFAGGDVVVVVGVPN